MNKFVIGGIAVTGLLYLATRKRKKKDSKVHITIKNPIKLSHKNTKTLACAAGVIFSCGYLLARMKYDKSYESERNQGAVELISKLVERRFPDAGVVYHEDHFTNGRDFEDDVITYLRGIGLREEKDFAVVERDDLGLWFKYII